jgi:hypothetical protein
MSTTTSRRVMVRRPVLAIVCCAFFLLTCCVCVAEETMGGGQVPTLHGTVDFKTASGEDAEFYYLGDTAYVKVHGAKELGDLAPHFWLTVTDSKGGVQFEDDWYGDLPLDVTVSFLIDNGAPDGTWKAELTYTSWGSSPNGVKLDTDKVDVLAGLWAVIVDGGTIGGNLQDSIDEGAREAYTAIMSRGYHEERICLLTPYNDFDADNDGDNDQNRVATVANVQWAIETWLDCSSENDRVFIYFVNHGLPEGFIVSDGTLWAEDVGGWIDGVAASGLVFVIEACYSGSWEDDVAGADRIFVSSADDNELAYVMWGTILFSHSFFTELNEGASVENAFTVAYNYVEATTDGWQNPQMNDQIEGKYFL